jgi:NADH-quinone oxidoreductase subunit M
VIFGEMVRVELRSIPDVTRREMLIFAPLIAGTVILGVAPTYATDLFGPSVAALVEGVQSQLAALAPITVAVD